MIKPLKGAVFASAFLALVLIPSACKTKKTPPPKVIPTLTTTAVETTPPAVDPKASMPVEPTTRDFVNDQKVTTETLPADVEELNRKAQSQGWLQDAFFGYDEAGLSAEAQSALQSSATWLKNHPDYKLLVEGHCDERGTEQFNLALGDRRASTVKDYLATLGVDAGRIRTVSYGEERPFDNGHEEQAWAKNRRGHLVLVGK